MFLKAIEMQGFKSFADKTKISFDRGVTAVVGPNGSGKSNITESLRWALGESSAKSLRGGKMPDVIFAGTQTRSPLNYARVAVTLDNSDAFISAAEKEICVERHIYRNGDSDYLIDGKKVRLRDVHDLFMDTGLGRDSFSIISQGRVEAIFNSKPEERRAIFEDAAGVLKYKTRKKETQHKLDKTQDNLNRLEDIIYELDLQLPPLKAQMKVAKQFLVLEEERKNLGLDVLIHQIVTNQDEKKTLDHQLLSSQQALDEYNTKKIGFETKYRKIKANRHNEVDQINQLQDNLRHLTQAVNDVEKKAALLNLETSQRLDKQADLTTQRQQLEQDIKRLNLLVTEQNDKLKNLQDKYEQTQQALRQSKKKKKDLDTDPERLLETLREKFLGLMQQEADIKTHLTKITTELSQYQTKQTVEEEQEAKIRADLDHSKKQVQKQLHYFEEQKEVVQDLLNQYQRHSENYEKMQKKYQLLQSEMLDIMDFIKSKEAKQQSLVAIQKNHSQFYAGVRTVLQHSSQLGGIIGAVSEHLSFEHTYQTALEIALGASNQHIIVSDEAAAKRAIQFLKQHKSGRATFLPLTTIKSRFLSERQQLILQSSEGFLGMASDLSTFDRELADIFQNILGTTAIFETVDAANSAAKQLHYQVRLITLDGTELRPGGSFAGGSLRQNSTLFIKPELERLEKELLTLKENLSKKEMEVTAAKKALDNLKIAISETKTSGDTARLSEQKAQLYYEQELSRLQELEQIHDGLVSNNQQKISENLHEEQVALTKTLENLSKEKQELNQEMTNLKENKMLLSQTLEVITEEINQLMLSERELSNHIQFEQENLSRVLNELGQKEQQNEMVISLLSSTDVNSSEKIENLNHQLSTFQSEKETCQQNLIKAQYALEDLESQLEELEEQLMQLNVQNEDLIRQQTRLESDLERVQDNLRKLASSLSQDYQMSFGEAKKIARFLENPEQGYQRLQDLKKQIKSLGPVNLDAITQYDDIAKRFEFLTQQKEDLIQAKDLLVETISDMDDEVKIRFQTTFEAIRQSFKKTFARMFGGGKADLILTDSDLLTAGVEISVQPPGKKIQSMNLMSGGEKALSALALLFAIIDVKTIPFVILDEVEAALDEANVKRFGAYLNHFDKSSQFIVVTHRKGTMAAADHIYGVTMQESGVSKLVSVTLKDAPNFE